VVSINLVSLGLEQAPVHWSHKYCLLRTKKQPFV